MSGDGRGDVEWATAAGAAIGGFFLEWMVIFVFVAASYDSAAATTGGFMIASLALPALCAGLLLSPRTRFFGVSVLIGLVLGSIVGAGVCAGYLVTLG